MGSRFAITKIIHLAAKCKWRLTFFCKCVKGLSVSSGANRLLLASQTASFSISPKFIWADFSISPKFGEAEFSISPKFVWADFAISPKFGEALGVLKEMHVYGLILVTIHKPELCLFFTSNAINRNFLGSPAP